MLRYHHEVEGCEVLCPLVIVLVEEHHVDSSTQVYVCHATPVHTPLCDNVGVKHALEARGCE